VLSESNEVLHGATKKCHSTARSQFSKTQPHVYNRLITTPSSWTMSTNQTSCSVGRVGGGEVKYNGLKITRHGTVRYSTVWHGLPSHSTNYRSFWRQFYGSDDPTNSVIALKDNGKSTSTCPATGSSCCNVASTNTAVFPMPDLAWQTTSMPRIA